MFDLFDRCLIAGIVLAVGGLILLHKRKQSEGIESANVFVGVPLVDIHMDVHEPSAIIIEFPMHRRPMYDALPGFGWEEAETIDLAEWKQRRLQRMQVPQNTREGMV